MATLRAARLRSKVVTQGKHHHKNGCGGNQHFGGQAVLHLGKLPRSIAPWFNYDKRFNKTTLSNIRCSITPRIALLQANQRITEGQGTSGGSIGTFGAGVEPARYRCLAMLLKCWEQAEFASPISELNS